MRIGRLLWGIIASSSVLPACMFFRSLDDLERDRASSEAGAGEASVNNDGATAPDAQASRDGAATDGATRFCATQGNDLDAGFFQCFDYEDDAGLAFDNYGGVTVDVENDDQHGRGLAVRVPAFGNSGFGGARHEIGVGFAPKRVVLSYDWRLEWVDGKASMSATGPNVFRGDVYTYLFFDMAAKGVGLNEQDQRVQPLVNGPPQPRAAVDLHAWHRFDFDVDYSTSKYAIAIDGVPRLSGDLTMSNAGGADAWIWIGTPYYTDNAEPVVFRYDDVVVKAFR